MPTSRWALLPPFSTFSAAYLTKVGKNGIRSCSPYSAIHEIPYRSAGIEMGSESWKMEMQWHFHAFRLFRMGWKEAFCNLDKSVSLFTLLSSQGNIFPCWCLLLIRLSESRSEQDAEWWRRDFTASRMVEPHLEFAKLPQWQRVAVLI